MMVACCAVCVGGSDVQTVKDARRSLINSVLSKVCVCVFNVAAVNRSALTSLVADLAVVPVPPPPPLSLLTVPAETGPLSVVSVFRLDWFYSDCLHTNPVRYRLFSACVWSAHPS